MDIGTGMGMRFRIHFENGTTKVIAKSILIAIEYVLKWVGSISFVALCLTDGNIKWIKTGVWLI